MSSKEGSEGKDSWYNSSKIRKTDENERIEISEGNNNDD
jgi:hypothetical protein